MNRERLTNLVWAVVLPFCVALGGLGMMVTGLNLRVDLLPLAFLCLMAAVGLCVLLCQKYGGWVAAAALTAVWLLPSLRLQMKAIGRTIAKFMSMAYGISSPQWLDGKRPGTLLPVLLVLGCLIMVPWIRSVLKGKSIAPGMAAALIPLACCITVTDTVPDAPWVFLWMLPMVLVMLTQGVRRRNMGQGNRVIAIVAIPAALVVALLFLLIPEKEADRWDISDMLNSIARQMPFIEETDEGLVLDISQSKPEDRVNLSTMGARNPSSRQIMIVTADYRGMLYLRERDYDQYNGLYWISDPERKEELQVIDSSYATGEGNVYVDVQYTRDYYYLPCYADQSVTLAGGMLKNPARERSYLFSTRKLRSDWYEGEGTGAAVDEAYLQLPEQTADEARSYLLKMGFVDGGTVAQRAAFIRALVERCAEYDIETGRMPSDQEDFAMWFLKEGERGYCVHFATTAAVLLRAAGIPARYVTGYLIGVQPNQTVAVEQRHGHAWVEYYVDGVGWLILEATPGDGLYEEQTTPTQPQQTQPTQPTRPQPTQPGQTQPTQTEPTQTQPTQTQPTQPQQTQPGGTQPATGQQSAEGRWMIWLILPAVLVMAVGVWVVLCVRRRRTIEKRMHTGHPNAQALARYRELCRLAAILNLPIPGELTQLAQKAKFSHHTLTNGELEALSAQIREMQEKLQELPLRKRLKEKWFTTFYRER